MGFHKDALDNFSFFKLHANYMESTVAWYNCVVQPKDDKNSTVEGNWCHDLGMRGRQSKASGHVPLWHQYM